jgi:hypothetical protein
MIHKEKLLSAAAGEGPGFRGDEGRAEWAEAAGVPGGCGSGLSSHPGRRVARAWRGGKLRVRRAAAAALGALSLFGASFDVLPQPLPEFSARNLSTAHLSIMAESGPTAGRLEGLANQN